MSGNPLEQHDRLLICSVLSSAGEGTAATQRATEPQLVVHMTRC